MTNKNEELIKALRTLIVVFNRFIYSVNNAYQAGSLQMTRDDLIELNSSLVKNIVVCRRLIYKLSETDTAGELLS